jgi:hypothetical protein
MAADDPKVELDLDEMLAARHEERGENHYVKLGGETVELPPKVPTGYVRAATATDVDGMVDALFGKQAPIFWANVPDWEDADTVLGKILEQVYGLTQGESQPSALPLNRAGRRSRATSNGSIR